MVSQLILRASPLQIGSLIVGLSVLVIGSAFAFEWAGYRPCHLCLQQREPWYGLLLLLPLAFSLSYFAPRLPGRIYIGVFAVALCLAAYNAGLGAYHAGVEWKLWKGPPECTATDAMLTPDLTALDPRGVVRCDDAAWRDPVLGLSMAGYNVLASLAAMVLAGLAGVRVFQGARLVSLLQPGLRRLRLKGSPHER